MKTYRLEDGKYEIDRDDQTGLMLAARRNAEPWPEGLVGLQYAKVVHAMLNRIDELEGHQGVAIVREQLEDNCARVQWVFNPVPEGEELSWSGGLS